MLFAAVAAVFFTDTLASVVFAVEVTVVLEAGIGMMAAAFQLFLDFPILN